MKEPYPPFSYSIPAGDIKVAEEALAQVMLSEPVKSMGHRSFTVNSSWNSLRKILQCDRCGAKVKVFHEANNFTYNYFKGPRWVVEGDAVAVRCGIKGPIEPGAEPEVPIEAPTGRMNAMKGVG